MEEVKETKPSVVVKEIPPHECKLKLIVVQETHDLNNSHNIVVARLSKCKICGKKFESFDPKGL